MWFGEVCVVKGRGNDNTLVLVNDTRALFHVVVVLWRTKVK